MEFCSLPLYWGRDRNESDISKHWQTTMARHDVIWVNWPFNLEALFFWWSQKRQNKRYLISTVYLCFSCLNVWQKLGWGSIIIGKNIEQLSGMQSMSFVMFPWGFITESEAGSCRPSHWATHLVPADAFTALRLGWPSGCTAEHQNINTAQTQLGPWEYLQGKQDRLLSLWKTETHSRQGDQCKQSKKMLCSTKRQFDSLQNSHLEELHLRQLSPVLALLKEENRWVYWRTVCGRRGEEKQ